MTTLLDSPTAVVAARLERAKEQLGRAHVEAAVDLLMAGGWCEEDAREAVAYGLAASYLVAAENERED
jgi:hypothetical protein